MQEAEERLKEVGEHSDGWSLIGMDGTGCSAGRFSIHSAMASFMRGASAGQKNSGRGYGQEKTRLELSSSWHHEPGQVLRGRAGLPPSWLSAEGT